MVGMRIPASDNVSYRTSIVSEIRHSCPRPLRNKGEMDMDDDDDQ